MCQLMFVTPFMRFHCCNPEPDAPLAQKCSDLETHPRPQTSGTWQRTVEALEGRCDV